MRCPACRGKTQVLRKRRSENLDTDVRRCECLESQCGIRFTTYERVTLRSLQEIGRRKSPSQSLSYLSRTFG